MVLFDSESPRRKKKDDDLWSRWNWKKIVRTVLVSLCVACVMLAATLIVLVKKSSSFRQGILAKAEHNIYASTGARVSARDFTLSFFPPTLDLYGVAVHGSEPEFSQPLLYADRVAAELKFSSLRYRRWNLRAIIVDRPVIHYSIDATGQSNLPQPESKSRNTAHVFDLAVEKVQIRGGELYRNDARIPLEAELHHLRFTTDYEGHARRYRSALRYAQGTVRAGSYALLDHSLESDFELTPARLTVTHLGLTAGKFRLSLSGSVEDFNHPAVQATFDSQLDTADVEPFLKTALPVAGMVHLAGSLNYRSDSGRSPLETVSLDGTISSPDITITAADLRADAIDAGAKYKLAGGNAEFENIHAQLFGGKLTGSLVIHDLAGARHATLEARLKDGSLEQLQRARRRIIAPDARLSGALQADAAASWSKNFEDLTARGNLSAQGALGHTSSTPLRAVVHAEYAAAGKQLSLRQTFIKTAQTSLTLEGSAGDKSTLQVSLHSGNLHEVELLAENFRPFAFGPANELSPSLALSSSSSEDKMDLYGAATFTAFITDASGVPQLKGQLEARDLRVKGTSWKLLRADVEATPTSLTFSNGNLEAAFPEPKTAADSPHVVHVRASSLPLRRIPAAEANLRGAIPAAESK